MVRMSREDRDRRDRGYARDYHRGNDRGHHRGHDCGPDRGASEATISVSVQVRVRGLRRNASVRDHPLIGAVVQAAVAGVITLGPGACWRFALFVVGRWKCKDSVRVRVEVANTPSERSMLRQFLASMARSQKHIKTRIGEHTYSP